METSSTPIPLQAPPLLWCVFLFAAAVWWLLPLIERWQKVAGSSIPTIAAPHGVANDNVFVAPSSSILSNDLPEEDASCPDEQLVSTLDFNPNQAFKDAYAESCRLVGEVLAVPPNGNRYVQAMSALHQIAAILDRLFESWSDEEAVKRLSAIKEESEAFSKTFGSFQEHNAAQLLLAHSGFKRQLRDASGNTKGAFWSFEAHDSLSRLYGLSVRLCLQRLADLQRVRGTMRWVQTNNSAVVPSPDDASILDLLDVYRGSRVKNDSTVSPSLREKNAEAEIRIKLQERRAEAGLMTSLALHEGLSLAARSLAQAQRLCVRRTGEIPKRTSIAEVKAALARLPLPPGFDAAFLHFSSDELPRLFGLAPSTGSKATPMGGHSNADDKDSAADILAREVVGRWAARQAQHVNWPFAALIGVGVALDYTVNRGFIVALLVGFDGLDPHADKAFQKRREEKTSLRQRQAAATAAVEQKARESAAAGSSGGQVYGARVRTLGDPNSDAKLNPK